MTSTPIEPAASPPSTVGCDLVVLLQDLEEMQGVLFPDIFDAEIIDYLDKLDGAPFMAPDTSCCGCLVVSCLLKTCAQQVISSSTSTKIGRAS